VPGDAQGADQTFVARPDERFHRPARRKNLIQFFLSGDGMDLIQIDHAGAQQPERLV